MALKNGVDQRGERAALSYQKKGTEEEQEECDGNHPPLLVIPQERPILREEARPFTPL
jgi:hypothetical protein